MLLSMQVTIIGCTVESRCSVIDVDSSHDTCATRGVAAKFPVPRHLYIVQYLLNAIV